MNPNTRIISREVHGNAVPRIDALMQPVVWVNGRTPIIAWANPGSASNENRVPQRNVIGMMIRLVIRVWVRWELASIPQVTPSMENTRHDTTIITIADTVRFMSALTHSPNA